MALARLSLLKAPQFLNETAVTFDNDFKKLLETCSEIADQYTNRNLIRATYTDEVYTGDDTNMLFVNNWPVTTLTTVKIFDGADSFDTETATNYTLINNRWIQFPALGKEGSASFGRWPRLENQPGNIQLTYTGGYDDSDWDTEAITTGFNVFPGPPADLEYAIAAMALELWQKSRKDAKTTRGIQSETVAVQTVTMTTFNQFFSKDIIAMLNPYRNLSFASHITK